MVTRILLRAKLRFSGDNWQFAWCSLKKEKADRKTLAALNADIKEKDKAARELETRADNIDAAVFDLKAVNPNAVVKVDSRTPQEIIANIETQGTIVSDALARLNALLAEAD